MSQKFEKQEVDFRGLHLCDRCWNGDGNHVNCEHGDCECPCQKLDQNLRDEALRRRQTKIANKRAQMTIDTGDDVIRVGPTKHSDLG
jgi:hypothetical protein